MILFLLIDKKNKESKVSESIEDSLEEINR